MKKFSWNLFLVFMAMSVFVQAQFNEKFSEIYRNGDGRVIFASVDKQTHITEEAAGTFIKELLNGKDLDLVLEKTERDPEGFVHHRYIFEKNDVAYANKRIMAHFRNGRLVSLNGDLELPAKITDGGFSLNEEAALAAALHKINASVYKWQNPADERHMKEVLNDPDFSYYPHGKKVWFEKSGSLYPAWQFNIYAEQPLYRANVFVNASTGEVLDEQNLLCTADVPGNAATKYSGTQTMTCDQNGSNFRLRQSQRGLGIETYNLNNGTSHGAAQDFTNASVSWTSVGTDQGATDAHWGAEKTYDYYWTQHNRNSINNAGFKLLSYVHYGNNYSNAFWDGQRMTYGDGNGGSYKIFTALDICGHEITHGLTDFSSNLVYSYESGALNESFSDIFGAAIENYARPLNWNWKMGEDISASGNGLRDMSNPKAYYDPHTYKGTYWYSGSGDNGGVHTNSGVPNYWFYLLVTGGSAVNDLGDPYSVQAIGMTAASRIAFRALTVYFTPTTDFAAARIACIQSAKDLYGDCSNEMIQTANAWYAVGVGQQVSATAVNPDFNAGVQGFCSYPATVSFQNATPYAQSYNWDFGDGNTSTLTNPVHTYTAPGNYQVKLTAMGCSATDSVAKQSYISINPPAAPVVSGGAGCFGQMAVLSAQADGHTQWYSSPTSTNVTNFGNLVSVSNITTNVTYYVTNTYTFAPFTGGMLAPSGGSYLSNNSHYLTFDVLQNSTLNSVVVHAQAAGLRTVELRSPSKTVLHTKQISLTAGQNTLTLDFPLVPGSGYELGLSGSSMSDLYRSNTGISFPYAVGNCANITGSSAGASYYYWFYKWTISRSACVSNPAAVTATVHPLPVVTLGVPSTVVCVGDEVNIETAPQGGSLMGAGVQGTAFQTSSLSPGNYTLTYHYTDNNGCKDSSGIVMVAQDCTGLPENAGSGQVVIYPNPATDAVNVSGLPSQALLRVFDGNGRLLSEHRTNTDSYRLELGGVAKGLYLVTVSDLQGGVSSAVRLIRE